ncbi:expressed unknown protein [Seminavis robusta]|uniref:Uncharacterized protein n=1 Tax=Seminavis robusta TaxID=568900 RepID=A0A9N8H007_9STRA|nr:expressed unknown protein [Seminavis robusta]|eukprot:Sro12_g009320.1 n/a (122) ;mRNA; f:89475-89840
MTAGRTTNVHSLVEIGATFLAGFVTSFALLNAVWYLVPSVDDEGAGPDSQTAPQPPPRFPWEPIQEGGREEIDGTTMPPLTTKVHRPSKPVEDSTGIQLQFLAQMTFANGGIRAPSCPCCI